MKRLLLFFVLLFALYSCEECDQSICVEETPEVTFRLVDTNGVDLILAGSIPIDSIVIFDTLLQKNISFDTAVDDTAFWMYFSYDGLAFEEINYLVSVPDSNDFYLGFFSQLKDQECCNYLDVFNAFAKEQDYFYYGNDTIDIYIELE